MSNIEPKERMKNKFVELLKSAALHKMGNVTMCKSLAQFSEEQNLGVQGDISKSGKGSRIIIGDLYWKLRDELETEGKIILGKGKGGSVRLSESELGIAESEMASQSDQNDAKKTNKKLKKEIDTYDGIFKTLNDAWIKNQKYPNAWTQITAHQGKRETGGKWTRPDIAMVSVTSLPYLPGKIVDISTFEIKLYEEVDITAVYEAVAHRRFATKAYLLIANPNKKEFDRESISEIESEAEKAGIGLSVISDEEDFGEWDEILPAIRYEPDPYRMNDFLRTTFTKDILEDLLKNIK